VDAALALFWQPLQHAVSSSTTRGLDILAKHEPAQTEPHWHTLSSEQVSETLRVDRQRGLTRDDAAQRLRQHGRNALAPPRQRSALKVFLHQLASLMVGLLVVAGGVALALGQWVEAITISIVILLNALIGFATEWKAASALSGLRMQAQAVARVLRDSVESQLDAELLVPGDVVLLSAGDRVPADGRLLEQARLQVDESALTGESLPAAKTLEASADARTPTADQSCMVHLGSVVTNGRGTFLVTATGPATELGRIGRLVAEVGEQATPLEAKLARLSRALLVVVLTLCAVIVLMGWLRGNDLLFMVEVGVSLAIAAVPEGLLAVTTMTLAVGMQRMAAMNALVRRLPAVEALGSTTVICTDKTGTLTRNEMTVRSLHVAGLRIDVSGAGYAVEGQLELDGQKVVPLALAGDSPLSLALRIGALCNDAKLDRTAGETRVLGDPTEAALIVAAEKAGLSPAQLVRDYPRTAELPFDSNTKRMTTVHRLRDGTSVAYVKGSPAAVLEASQSLLGPLRTAAMSAEDRHGVSEQNTELAASALRVLGLAYRVLPEPYTDEDLGRGLTFVGLVAMMDPLREEARLTVARCGRAGIRTVMITGDQLATASEVARQLGLTVDAQQRPLEVVHARELNDLDADGWLEVVRRAAVFVRASPEHKLKIVEALQKQGNVVAMTGDGVNDAPALQQADIGIAMGVRGTEVAKDAADMIITDDNFATIVDAVEQGRVIVNNILRFIHYLFSSNLSEILTMFVAVMLGWPVPLAVLQILWLNLVTDIFPALALALEPSAPDVMKRPPRAPDEPLLSLRFGWLIVWQGALLASCALTAFTLGRRWYGSEGSGLGHAVTLCFMTLGTGQVLHAFNTRSRTKSAFTSALFSNGWLWGAALVCILLQVAAVRVPLFQRVLHTVPLNAQDVQLVGALGLAPVVVVELVKWVQRARRERKLDYSPSEASQAMLVSSNGANTGGR
jgi:Ca2+-transporting ATPase